MKVLYFIYSSGQASGGHYHSCDQITRELGKYLEIGLFSIGPNESKLLTRNPNFKGHLAYRSLTDLSAVNAQLKAYKKELDPDVIHCFDAGSLNLLLLLPTYWQKKIVLTKCGGPNPQRSNWQHADSHIMFSEENFEWFRQNPNYRGEPLHLIPNRVSGLQWTPEAERDVEKEKDKFCFLRISRLGGAYEKTLLDTYRLIEKLMDRHSVKLYVIGRIQNRERFEILRAEAEKRALPVTFITDERARKAARFLYLADAVIGTGRSFMEALSLGIPALTPCSNHDMPVLVTPQNFKSFFRTNFSERNVADEQSLQHIEKDILQLVNDRAFHQQTARNSKMLFEEYLDAAKIKGAYTKVYQDCLHDQASTRLILLRKNFPYLFKALMRRS